MTLHLLVLLILAALACALAYAANRAWKHNEPGDDLTIVAILLGVLSGWFLIAVIALVAQDIGGLPFPALWPMYWPLAVMLLLAGIVYEIYQYRTGEMYSVLIALLVVVIAILAIYLGFAIDHAVAAANHIQLHGIKAPKKAA